MTEDDLDESLTEIASQDVPRDRAERYYDRIRTRIQKYIESKGGAVEKTAELLLLVPDFFILLWRLVNDARVQGKNKVLLGSGVAYFLFPIDLMPEAFLGPVGFADDLVLAVFILNKVLADTSADVIRQHWSGDEDILATIQRVLNAADSLVSTDLLDRIKKMVK